MTFAHNFIYDQLIHNGLLASRLIIKIPSIFYFKIVDTLHMQKCLYAHIYISMVTPLRNCMNENSMVAFYYTHVPFGVSTDDVLATTIKRCNNITIHLQYTKCIRINRRCMHCIVKHRFTLCCMHMYLYSWDYVMYYLRLPGNGY